MDLGADAVVIAAAGGSDFTGIVTRNGRVYTFGGNATGQLGEMSTLDRDKADTNLGRLPEAGADGSMQMQLKAFG